MTNESTLNSVELESYSLDNRRKSEKGSEKRRYEYLYSQAPIKGNRHTDALRRCLLANGIPGRLLWNRRFQKSLSSFRYTPRTRARTAWTMW